jgi:hypothetical protein
MKLIHSIHHTIRLMVLIIIKHTILVDSLKIVTIGEQLTQEKKGLFGTGIGKHFGHINIQDYILIYRAKKLLMIFWHFNYFCISLLKIKTYDERRTRISKLLHKTFR